MEGSENFQFLLEEAVIKKKAEIEKKNLAELKEYFQKMQISVKGLLSILIRKSLLQEDPYKYDKQISEVCLPSSAPFTESEKITQMSIRMAEYERQFEFICNYYQFSVDFINLKRIKLLVDLVKYIKWDELRNNSTFINTRTLADLLGKVTRGTDNLSAGLIGDSVEQIVKSVKSILQILKSLASFHREVYKLNIRLSILSNFTIAEESALNQPDEIIKKVKSQFPSLFPNQPFYPELIREILNEDFGPQKESLRQHLLKKLEVKAETPKKKIQKVSFKAMLLESLRVLATAGPYLMDISNKLQASSILLANRKKSFSEKFKEWLNRIVGRAEDDDIYEVELLDSTTSTTKIERINFTEFLSDLQKRARFLTNCTNKLSTTYKRLENSEEEKIFEFLSLTISDVQKYLKLTPALDIYFRSEIPKIERAKIRGVKLELNSIKNYLIKANQKKHEYVAKKEETEQLQKLGISSMAHSS